MAAAGLAGGNTFDAETLQKFFAGIKKYQGHYYTRSIEHLPVFWEAGSVKLLRVSSAKNRHKQKIILIPSMVNGSDILDLVEGRSLARFLASAGFETYMLDWGQPAADAELSDIDRLMTQRLIPALEAIGGNVGILGYCMGGLLGAAAARLRPDLVTALAVFAMPWNFHDEKGALRARLAMARPAAMLFMTQYGRLPEAWMQAVFATLDPEGSIRKFAAFADMAADDPRAEIFMAVEDWLNDGADLPAKIATMCMEQWYEQNLPAKGEWRVCGEFIRAQDIQARTLVVAAKDDKIVPLDSALAFAEHRVKGETLLCNTGHVGLIASSRAVEDIWRPIAEWFAADA